MTQTTTHTALAYLTDAPRLPLLATLALRVVVFAVKCQERRRTRMQLSHLDPHLLRDVGLTDAQAQRETAKRFWQV